MATVQSYRPAYVTGGPIPVRYLRTRITTAQCNTGYTLLPPIPRMGYRLIDIMLIAVGGTAGTATSVDINSTQGGSAIKPMIALRAALARSAVVKLNSANVTPRADGGAMKLNDANTLIQIKTAGSALDTTTHVDILLRYTIEPN